MELEVLLGILFYGIFAILTVVPLILGIVGMATKKKKLYWASGIIVLVYLAVSTICELVIRRYLIITYFLLAVFLVAYYILWVIQVITLKREAIVTGTVICAVNILYFLLSFICEDKITGEGIRIIIGFFFCVFCISLETVMLAIYKNKKEEIGLTHKEKQDKKEEVDSLDEIIY